MRKSLWLLASFTSLCVCSSVPSVVFAVEPSGDAPGAAVAAGHAEREARMEAMRGLAGSYPSGGGDAPGAPVSSASDASAGTRVPVVVSPRIMPSAPNSTDRLPRLEHHGYFRTRVAAFGNYDLNTRGTSPVPAPLDSKQRGGSQQENIKTGDSDAHLGANMRFRYEPTFHISETVRIAGTFDVMDNFVMGTTPAGLRSDWGADSFFSFDGAGPVGKDTVGSEVFKVKALYGEADTLLGTFRAGRIPVHWGAGMVYNDGGHYNVETQAVEGHAWKCLDCDSSDSLDRIEYRLRDPFFDVLYLDFAWDFVNQGLASYTQQRDSVGQAFDLADADDVLQFSLSLFDRPVSRQEIDERYRALFEDRVFAYDWGALFTYRSQTMAAEPDAVRTGDGASASYSLYEKEAKAYIFDLWGRAYIPLPKDITLRLEAEFAGVFGNVSLDGGPDGDERDITQIGLALEAEVWWRDLVAGVKTGFACSDNMVYSGHSILDSLDEVPMGSIFRFDPNYRVDDIMFHELMDGINNAWYLNLYGEYKFPVQMPQATTALGARVDLTSSWAMDKDVTPGKSVFYGFEAGARLFYEETDRMRVQIGAGFLVPGGAWKHRSRSDYPILPSQSVYEDSTTKSYDAETAWDVNAALIFMF